MKKVTLWMIVVLLLAGMIAAGMTWFHSHKIVLGDEIFDRNTSSLKIEDHDMLEVETLQELTYLQELDLREVQLTVQEYMQLCAALPNCEIIWSVPFQDQFLDSGTRELTVTELSKEDLQLFQYFPDLSTIHAEECRDYDHLILLQSEYPNLNVQFQIHFAGASYPLDTTQMTVENVDAEELKAILPYLPQLTDVYFTGIIPGNEVMYDLKCFRQDVVFHWNFSLFGVETSSTASELILNDITMENTDAVEDALKYFYHLERVEMCNCGISSEDMDALWKRHPETRFIWTIHIRDAVVRTDVTALIPYKLGYYMWNRLYDKDCTELKYLVDLVCLDMGHMNITDYSFLEFMPKLKYLVIIDTKGTDFSPLVHLKELIYLEIFFTNFSQTELLLELPNLQDLNIGFTPRPDLDVLKQMTWLKRLWMPKTGITGAEFKELQKALANTQVVMNVEHSTAGNWRDNDNYRAMRDLLGMGYMK